MALFLASLVSMGLGIAYTLSRLDRTEWRKWRQWRLIKPRVALWPIWLMVTAVCLLAIALGHASLSWTLGALASMGALWRTLDRSVRRHILRERRRRHAEMGHWQHRIRAERWLAQQSLMKRRELARVQADSLRHLMDPHFLFNALNGVMNDFLRGDREAGLSNLRAFRRLAVDQIEAGRGGWLTLEREWSMLKDYIQLELRRINRPVEWTLHPVPDEMKSQEIPAFMIQPLVENALWHGLGGTAITGAGRLSIEVHPDSMGRAVILIRNSRHPEQEDHQGNPIERHASPSRRRHATDLIRQRLELMDGQGNQAFGLEATESETRARLVLPCRRTMWTTC